MSETYPGLLADRKQKKFACSLTVRRAAQRAAGLELHLVKLDCPFPEATATGCGCGNSCQRGIGHLLYRTISLAEWTAWGGVAGLAMPMTAPNPACVRGP